MKKADAADQTDRLPKTRIAVLVVWLNSLSVVLIVSAAAIGFFITPPNGLMAIHILFGFSTCLLGIFGLVAAMFYLITTGAAIREALEEKKLSKDFYDRSRKLKKNLFPWCAAAIFLLIAATVIGGGVHMGSIPSYVHLLLSIAGLGVYIKTVRLMKSSFHENRALMADVLSLL